MSGSSQQDLYEVFAEFYDFIVPYRDRPDVPFFVELAREGKGPVLELGCGTGRILIPIAREGINITGLDASNAMLERCRSKLAEESLEAQSHVTLCHGDMRRFEFGREFALITAPFRSFQHLLTVEDQLACLSCVHHHLAERGKFVLDVFNPSLPHLVGEKQVSSLADEPEFTMPDGRRVTRRATFRERDLLNQIIRVDLRHDIVHPDGRQESQVENLELRYLFRFEVEHLLARSGFEVESIYADYDKTPFGVKYPGELVFVARKV